MRPLRSPIALDEQVAMDRALERAFAAGRRRTARIAPARARARAAWERPSQPSRRWRGVAFLGRLGEASIAAGLTAFVFAASLGGIDPASQSVGSPDSGGPVARVTAPLEDARFFRWMRIGRTGVIDDSVDASFVASPPGGEAAPASGPDRQALIRDNTDAGTATPRTNADAAAQLAERHGLIR